MIPLRWGLKPETSQVKSSLSTWKIGCCVFLFEPDFGTEFLTPEKIQVASFIPPCMFPDFRRYTTPSRGFTFLCCVDGISNSSLNSCFSSRHAMFTGQQVELCQKTRQRNRSARHQYMHFLGITASLLDLRPLLGLL